MTIIVVADLSTPSRRPAQVQPSRFQVLSHTHRPQHAPEWHGVSSLLRLKDWDTEGTMARHVLPEKAPSIPFLPRNCLLNDEFSGELQLPDPRDGGREMEGKDGGVSEALPDRLKRCGYFATL